MTPCGRSLWPTFWTRTRMDDSPAGADEIARHDFPLREWPRLCTDFLVRGNRQLALGGRGGRTFRSNRRPPMTLEQERQRRIVTTHVGSLPRPDALSKMMADGDTQSPAYAS